MRRKNKVERTSAQQAEGVVRSWILSGELRAGSRISERDVAEHLGLSRTPVREAIGRLEADGLLRRQGRSLVVWEIGIEEVVEVLAVRLLLESEAAYLAASRLHDDQIAAMMTALESLGTSEQATPARHWKVDDMVHLGIADGSGNRHYARIIRDMRERTRIFGIDRIPKRFDVGRTEHIKIVAALAARDPEAARMAMSTHIQNVRLGIIETLTGGGSSLSPFQK